MKQITEQEHEALRRVAEAAMAIMGNTEFEPHNGYALDLEAALEDWVELERSKR